MGHQASSLPAAHRKAFHVCLAGETDSGTELCIAAGFEMTIVLSFIHSDIRLG
jgi:hypothetical protein